MATPKQHPVVKTCQEAVGRRWGKEARENVGDVVYEALLNSALVNICTGQDESVDPAAIVKVMREARSGIIEVIHGDS